MAKSTSRGQIAVKTRKRKEPMKGPKVFWPFLYEEWAKGAILFSPGFQA